MRNQQTKTTKGSRACLGKCSTETWLASNNTRPKTIVLTLQRGKKGYTVENATILKRVNQYGAVPVEANVRAITNDLNKKGVTTH
jgi:hypothetical protein